MAESSAEKTEAPTQRRRKESRQDGSVARSTDLTAAAVILVAVIMLYWAGIRLLAGMKLTVQAMLASQFGSNATQPTDLAAMFASGGRIAVASIAPLLIAIVGTALAVAVMQVGVLFTPRPLIPRFSKLSPARGFKNLIDSRARMRLVMSLLKISLLAGVAVPVVMRDLPGIVTLAQLPVMQALGAACGVVFWLAIKLAALLLVLALIDFAFQRWRSEQDMKMTKQEVKEDLKQMEGDPMTKQRRLRIARQLAMQRIQQDVPKADVVVMNPTHYAVAVCYDSASMRAPKLSAKGADFLAMRIRQIAIVHGVPIVERPEVARAIYRGVEIGQEVPPQFYSAVAEILAYVYRISGKRISA